MSGVIFNIQKYSIHDGPGIRTTVFLKGCPLSCSWCHNPESQSFEKELLFFSNRCINCGECLKVCNNMRKAELCTMCGSCASVCCTNAIELAGKEISVEALIKELEKDVIFYDSSKGGVTISGGEPLGQSEFTLELLLECKKRDINTAVDTSGYGNTDALEKIAGFADLFLYDIKLMDNEKHIQYTGVSNNLILHNLKMLSESGKKIWIRIPVIPGINDNAANIEATSKLIKSTVGIQQVNLLPYHNTAMDKYRRLNKKYDLQDVKQPQKEYMDIILDLYRKQGINAYVGG